VWYRALVDRLASSAAQQVDPGDGVGPAVNRGASGFDDTVPSGLPSAESLLRGGDGTTARPTSPSATSAALNEPTGRTLSSGDEPCTPAPGDVCAGMVLAGKYELVRLLGQGGMGKVYKGQHLGLGIPIAVKTMHPEIAASPNYVRRFRHEAHAASLLNHPNAVRVLDFGNDAGTLYLVMEYLEGRSLTRWLGELHAPPPLADVAEIMAQLFDAFQVAHGYGIVHRDLKPDNVFLTDVGGKRTVKVVDFGLAHVDDARDQGPTLTSKDVIAGTPEYMSPEQCRSLAVGSSADIYSCGCLLTELLQLRPPFSGASAIEVLAKQMFTPPAALARPAGAEPVPPLLERLRLDLLSKAPEKRPKDAAEAKHRLLEAMSPEATAARLPTRKGDEPLGDRAARAPRWDAAEPAPATARTQTHARAVGLLRLGSDAGGVTSEHEAGLASQKLDVMLVNGPAEAAAQSLAVVVLDAGARHDVARAVLRQLAAAAPKCRAIVCAAELTTDRMNELVAAGAADVLRYPVTADTLGKKVERVLRRGR
jgi:serine/threonine protein kinase